MQNETAGELPLGFGMALAQNPEAMACFARLSPGERDAVLERSRRAQSRGQMQQIVNDLMPD